MPGAQCTRSLVCEVVSSRMHTSIHSGRTENHPASPHAMVLTASFVLSPAIGLFCHRHQRKLVFANLTPASRRQDHTTSPSASAPFVKSATRVHRIQPRVRDDRDTPLKWGGRRWV